MADPQTLPFADFLELYDAAHAVIDHIRLHADHAEYKGSMNAVIDFQEIATRLRWKHYKDDEAYERWLTEIDIGFEQR